MKSSNPYVAEKALKADNVISRDRAIQAKKFTSLFSIADEYCSESSELDVNVRELWENLLFIVVLMRQKNGATIADLIERTGLPGEEVRRCIRIVIDLGGEVQVICRDVQYANEGTFLLHN